jgi:hypothetical protein
MIKIQEVTSKVQSVLRQSPDIYWHAEMCCRPPEPAGHQTHTNAIFYP